VDKKWKKRFKGTSYMNCDNFQYIRQVEHMYMYTPFSVIHVSEM